MGRTEEFLDLYRQLENAATERFHFRNDGSQIYQLSRRPEFRGWSAEIDYCRDVRNLLSHRPKVDSSFGVEPSDEMVDLLRNILYKVEKPLLAEDIAVGIKKVFCCEMNDLVRPALKIMNERGISHVPILQKGVVVGVFSENTLLNLLLDNPGGYDVTDEMTFARIEAYLDFDYRKPEKFVFVSSDTHFSDLSEMFDRSMKRKEKIAMVFLTKSGSPTEKLNGIVTAWDIAAAATTYAIGKIN